MDEMILRKLFIKGINLIVSEFKSKKKESKVRQKRVVEGLKVHRGRITCFTDTQS